MGEQLSEPMKLTNIDEEDDVTSESDREFTPPRRNRSLENLSGRRGHRGWRPRSRSLNREQSRQSTNMNSQGGSAGPYRGRVRGTYMNRSQSFRQTQYNPNRDDQFNTNQSVRGGQGRWKSRRSRSLDSGDQYQSDFRGQNQGGRGQNQGNFRGQNQSNNWGERGQNQGGRNQNHGDFRGQSQGGRGQNQGDFRGQNQRGRGQNHGDFRGESQGDFRGQSQGGRGQNQGDFRDQNQGGRGQNQGNFRGQNQGGGGQHQGGGGQNQGDYRGQSQGGRGQYQGGRGQNQGGYRGQNQSNNWGGRGQNQGGRNQNQGGGQNQGERGQNQESSWGGRGQNQGQNQMSEGPNERRGMKMNNVNMPTGNSVKITVPATSHCNCRKRAVTNLIKLHPNGRMGQREYQIVNAQMQKTVKAHQGGAPTYKIISIEKVQNCCIWKRYRNYQRELGLDQRFMNEKMLFHGSSSVSDILIRGFDERHANQNGMFGAGIYFARHSSKSNQYAFGLMGGNGCKSHADKNCKICNRKMLLCRVTLGRECKKTFGERYSHAPPKFHSVVGEPSLLGLKYPEYVVYRAEQAYPEYVITYKVL